MEKTATVFSADNQVIIRESVLRIREPLKEASRGIMPEHRLGRGRQ